MTRLLAPEPGSIALEGFDWDAPSPVALANPEWVRRAPAAAARLPARLPPLADHVWLATSGSTSTDPAETTWVALGRGALFASAAAVNQHLASTASDVWAHALPLFHAGGLGILARARLSGARVIAGAPGRWDAWRFRERIVEESATLTALVPAQVHDLVAARLHAPPALRAVVVGGARLDPELFREARVLGWPCLPSYGLTETASQVATAALACLDRPDYPAILPLLPHAEAREGGDGRLELRAASLLSCYAVVGDAGVRTWDPRLDGWFTTDDLALVSAEGVEVLGRASDTVKVLGELVALGRVEEAVRRWAAGEAALRDRGIDLAVAAAAHPRLGHELVLVLAHPDAAVRASLNLEALGRSLEGVLRDALLPFERPRRLVTAGRIPRTALGKCRRRLLLREVGLEA